MRASIGGSPVWFLGSVSLVLLLQSGCGLPPDVPPTLSIEQIGTAVAQTLVAEAAEVVDPTAAPENTQMPTPTTPVIETETPTPTITLTPSITPSPSVTLPPVPTSPPPTTSNCHPSYPDVCIPIGSADYDCAGGSGNGPNYIQGPIRVRHDVPDPDPHGLDRDKDGVGCESG